MIEEKRCHKCIHKYVCKFLKILDEYRYWFVSNNFWSFAELCKHYKEIKGPDGND